MRLANLFLSLVAMAAILGFTDAATAQALPGFTDCSIASLSGTSTQIVAANPQRKYLELCNNGATNNVGVNFAGGTAAIAGAGTITLVPGSCKEYGALDSYLPWPPTGAVTVIGTSAQPIACYEGK